MCGVVGESEKKYITGTNISTCTRRICVWVNVGINLHWECFMVIEDERLRATGWKLEGLEVWGYTYGGDFSYFFFYIYFYLLSSLLLNSYILLSSSQFLRFGTVRVLLCCRSHVCIFLGCWMWRWFHFQIYYSSIPMLYSALLFDSPFSFWCCCSSTTNYTIHNPTDCCLFRMTLLPDDDELVLHIWMHEHLRNVKKGWWWWWLVFEDICTHIFLYFLFHFYYETEASIRVRINKKDSTYLSS